MIATRRFADSARTSYASRRRPSTWRNHRVSRFQLAPAGSTNPPLSIRAEVVRRSLAPNSGRAQVDSLSSRELQLAQEQLLPEIQAIRESPSQATGAAFQRSAHETDPSFAGDP